MMSGSWNLKSDFVYSSMANKRKLELTQVDRSMLSGGSIRCSIMVGGVRIGTMHGNLYGESMFGTSDLTDEQKSLLKAHEHNND